MEIDDRWLDRWLNSQTVDNKQVSRKLRDDRRNLTDDRQIDR